jgi:hypothetical protein
VVHGDGHREDRGETRRVAARGRVRRVISWGIIYMSPYLIDSTPNIVPDSRKGLMYIYDMEDMVMSNEIDVRFRWTCPSEGCRHEQEESVSELGPALNLVCGKCDQWFGEKDLRPEDAEAWDKAFREAERLAAVSGRL